jgi:hypothetical protein
MRGSTGAKGSDGKDGQTGMKGSTGSKGPKGSKGSACSCSSESDCDKKADIFICDFEDVTIHVGGKGCKNKNECKGSSSGGSSKDCISSSSSYSVNG